MTAHLHLQYNPTDEDRMRVQTMKGLRMSLPEIASVIFNPVTKKAIGVPALTKHFEVELARGEGYVREQVGKALLDRAVDPKSPTGLNAAIWIERSRYGLSDRNEEADADARTSFIEMMRMIVSSVPATPEAAKQADEQYKALEQTTKAARDAKEAGGERQAATI